MIIKENRLPFWRKGTICSNSTPGAPFLYPFFSECIEYEYIYLVGDVDLRPKHLEFWAVMTSLPGTQNNLSFIYWSGNCRSMTHGIYCGLMGILLMLINPKGGSIGINGRSQRLTYWRLSYLTLPTGKTFCDLCLSPISTDRRTDRTDGRGTVMHKSPSCNLHRWAKKLALNNNYCPSTLFRAWFISNTQ